MTANKIFDQNNFFMINSNTLKKFKIAMLYKLKEILGTRVTQDNNTSKLSSAILLYSDSQNLNLNNLIKETAILDCIESNLDFKSKKFSKEFNELGKKLNIIEMIDVLITKIK